jgi:hypothetical protein
MEGEKRSATGVGSGLPRAPAQRVQVQEGRRSSKSNGKRPQVDVHGSYRTEEDELRGMGLGMAVQQPGLNGHDHMTGGMGFGDQFWSGSFPNPTPGSDRKSPGFVEARLTLDSAPTLSHMLPNMSPSGSLFNTNNGVSPMAEFDIAQFVSAISSQMPRVQDASPQGASSSNTGPSPQTGDPNTKGNADKGKIVKVSWFRPHGITAIAPGTFPLTSGDTS